MAARERDTDHVQVIAIPAAGGRLCAHFAHCEQFAVYDVDLTNKQILNCRRLNPPAHQPGVLPRWLHDQGVNLVIASGMGGRAQNLFAQQGVEVIVGAPAEPPDEIVRSFLDGTLESGANLCDH